MYTVDEILDMNFQTITLHMKGTKRLLKSETSCTLYQSEAGMTTWMKFLKRGHGVITAINYNCHLTSALKILLDQCV